MNTARRRGSFVRILAGILLLAFATYVVIGVRAANGWAHPRRDTYLLATPASFNLQYQDVRFPSRDKEVEISGWWIPRAGSTKAIVMVHGRGENRTTEFYSHFLDLGAALNTFQGRGFNVLMIDLRAHGLSGGAVSAWGIAERHDVEAAVDWIKSRGFQAASIGALGASLGATSCVYATAEDPDINALVTDGAGVDEYASLQRGWARSSGTPQIFFSASRLVERILYGYDLHDLRPVDAMKRIPPRPVLADLRPAGIARGQRSASPAQGRAAGSRTVGGARRDAHRRLYAGSATVSAKSGRVLREQSQVGKRMGDGVRSNS